MNYNKYNPRCNSKTKWSYAGDGAVGEDDVDDDPDEACGDDDDDDDDFPSPGRNFPVDFSLPEIFSLSVVSAPEVAAEYFFEASPEIFLGQMGDIREWGEPEGRLEGGPQDGQMPPRRTPTLGRAWAPPGGPVPPPASPFHVYHPFDLKNHLGHFE